MGEYIDRCMKSPSHPSIFSFFFSILHCYILLWWQVWVLHISYKRKHPIWIYCKATSVKTTCTDKQHSGTGIPCQSPVQILGHHILDLSPSSVSTEVSFKLVSLFQCNCSGKRRLSVRPCMHRKVVLKLVWCSSSLYQPLPASDWYLFISMITKLLWSL